MRTILLLAALMLGGCDLFESEKETVTEPVVIPTEEITVVPERKYKEVCVNANREPVPCEEAGAVVVVPEKPKLTPKEECEKKGGTMGSSEVCRY